MIFKHSARLIKEIVDNNNISQADLARELKVHPQFISNIFRGLCGMPPAYAKVLKKYIALSKIEQAAIEDYRLKWREDIK